MLDNVSIIEKTTILGKEVNLYRSIENPLFLAKDVAEWIGHSKVSMMLKPIDNSEKVKVNKVYLEERTGGAGTWFLTEDGLYEVFMRSNKPIAKEMKQEIKKYLKSIRLTGAAIPEGREEQMVNYYFSNLSQDLQGKIVSELMQKNKELQQIYDDLINSDGFLSVNTCAKELGIGEFNLFTFLREHKVFFYNKEHINMPYERFRKEGKFIVRESICRDGNYRPTTYVTMKGLNYIRKLLRKHGYYENINAIG